jgi:hypothetical protein
MLIFLTLFVKIIPLYVFIILGFVAGKFLKVNKESIAPILIYIVAPIIVFYGVVTTKLSYSSLSLPFLCFFISIFLSTIFYFVGKLIWKDSTKNIFAYASGQGNFGYFGLPIALILFPKSLVGLYIMGILGFNVFDASVGFFLVARGHHTVSESIKKVILLPTLYGFILGLIINSMNINLGSIFVDAVGNVRGVYTVLGMMLIGLGIADIKAYSFDFIFTSLLLVIKFAVWPLLMLGIFFIDSNTFHLYNNDIHKVLLLLSIVPLAANTVAYATQLKVHPEKSALTVLISTLIALIYIPFFVTLFLQ